MQQSAPSPAAAADNVLMPTAPSLPEDWPEAVSFTVTGFVPGDGVPLGQPCCVEVSARTMALMCQRASILAALLLDAPLSQRTEEALCARLSDLIRRAILDGTVAEPLRALCNYNVPQAAFSALLCAIRDDFAAFERMLNPSNPLGYKGNLADLTQTAEHLGCGLLLSEFCEVHGIE